MCSVREQVIVVSDDQLGAAWAAATGSDGRKIVFVRESDVGLLDDYCARGQYQCPVMRALTSAA